MKKFLFLSFFLLISFFGFSQNMSSNNKLIKKHIQYLASDDLKGRQPGTESEHKAAKYIWEELKSYGCKEINGKNYHDFAVDIRQKSDTTKYDKLHGRNVMALLTGTKTPDKYIVVGAHYDHLGMGGYGSGSRKPDTVAVHNGADDNASGVSAMLESARILSKNRPDCSIIFVAFSLEEKGLIGSRIFVDDCPVEKEKIVAMINFDMVGRLDSILEIGGTGTASELNNIIDRVYEAKYFQLKKTEGGYGPSDHTSFYSEKIPVLYFHTTIHQEYHTPDDDIEYINFDGISRITSFASNIIYNIAKQNQKITYQQIGSPTEMSRMGMKATLGIMPDHNSVNGLKLSAVKPNQPAYNAGLEKGDIIIAIDGVKINDIESYMKQMSKYDKGQIITIDILRTGVKKIYTITL